MGLLVKEKGGRLGENRRTDVGRLPTTKRVGHSIIILLVIFGLEASCSRENQQPIDRMEHPNIVLVVVDALRRDHLGTYGYGPETSPNLDRLSESAVDTGCRSRSRPP